MVSVYNLHLILSANYTLFRTFSGLWDEVIPRYVKQAIVAGVGIEPTTSSYEPDETTSLALHLTSKVINIKAIHLLYQLSYIPGKNDRTRTDDPISKKSFITTLTW